MSDCQLQVHALASGSSGNAMLVQAGSVNVLIDAGLPLRTLASHLARHGVGQGNLNGILLTHEHTDHSAGAGALSRRMRTPILANAATLNALMMREPLPFDAQELSTGDCFEMGPMRITSFPVPHDAVECVGYGIEAGTQRIVYCTDTGHVNDAMRDALRGANLAIVEANHDREWLMRGPYSDEMKARVASPTGHLSNAECADWLASRLEADGPLSIWLAHLSRVNNSPALARRTVAAGIRAHTNVPFDLQIALRDHPSLSWRSGRQAVQLALL